jgi:hypothetical protein
MTEFTWKVGDWAVFEREIVQIKDIREGLGCSVSDGLFETCGHLLDRLRPLTLRNKRITEWFAWHYRELKKINGERGFNYPDISRHFAQLVLRAIDGEDDDQSAFDEAQAFIREARDYKTEIQGVQLFRAA